MPSFKDTRPVSAPSFRDPRQVVTATVPSDPKAAAPAAAPPAPADEEDDSGEQKPFEVGYYLEDRSPMVRQQKAPTDVPVPVDSTKDASASNTAAAGAGSPGPGSSAATSANDNQPSTLVALAPGQLKIHGNACGAPDVLRLAEFMQSAEMSGKVVMLIGFTDGEGKYWPNASISGRRASQVRSAILAAADGRIAPGAIVAKGYGPLAPIACNDTFERRQLNRRVEVWIKDK